MAMRPNKRVQPSSRALAADALSPLTSESTVSRKVVRVPEPGRGFTFRWRPWWSLARTVGGGLIALEPGMASCTSGCFEWT